MGDLTGITPPSFDWQSNNLPTAFDNFEQYCKLIFTGPLSKKSDAEKVTFLLLWLGQEGIKVYNSWDLTDQEKAKPEVVFEKFKKHFEPKSNFRINRYHLHNYRQQSNESTDDFIARCKIQARKCKYTDAALHEKLIEQLILGTRHKKIQESLLKKDETLTLDTALDIARTYEATQMQLEELTNTGNVNVNYVRKHKSQSGTNVKYPQCGKCGLNHKEGDCPAKGTKCSNCGKLNHWKRVCRSKSKPQQPPRERYKPNANKQRGTNRAKRSVNELSNDQDLVEQNDQRETDIEFNVIHIDLNQSQAKHRDEIMAKLEIQVPNESRRCTLKVKVDTGAEGNILPLRTFKHIFPGKVDAKGNPLPNATKASPTKITAYNGSQISHLGICTITCQYNGVKTPVDFYVVDVNKQVIVGLQTSLKLKLVTINCNLQVTGCTPINNTDDLFRLYPDRFEGIGQFKGSYHIVIDKDAHPVVHPARRVPIHIQTAIKRELDEMLQLDVIAPVEEPTDWVSSLAYTQKTNGRWRICLDPKDLNKVIKRPHHHIPTLDEITHKFAGAKFFSKLDAKHGYWSIALDKPSSYLTTFNSPFGRFRFKRLPFGLSISQDVFQQRMDQVLEKCTGTASIADDVAVFGATEEEHDQNLHKLFKVAREHGLVFNRTKCEIKKSSINFFGIRYDAEGTHPDPEKIEAVEHLKAPESKHELQEFLGIATYLSPFIPNLSTHTANLRNLIRKDAKYEWQQTHQEAFEKIKEMICEEVTLSYFDPRKDTTLQVDASLNGLGAVLMQDSKPIYFASRSLTDAEKRYANIERELLAVVFACEKFHMYVYRKQFTVESDHKPLEMIYLKNLVAAPARLQRLLLRLQGYQMRITYKPGKEMLLADAMSRLNPLPSRETVAINGINMSFSYFSNGKLTELKQTTNEDQEMTALREQIINGWPEKQRSLPQPLRQYWSYRDELTVEEGGVIMKGQRILIPKQCRKDILTKLHDAHQGIVKCQLRAKSTVFWPKINRDIEELVRSCPICMENSKAQSAEPLQPHEIPTRPWQVIGTDLFTLDGSDYLIVADYYSKYTLIKSIPKGRSNSPTVVNLLKSIFSEHGIPERVISDNGPQYSSHIFKEFSQLWNFQHITSSPHYPQSNGFIERQVQTVKHTIKKAKQSKTDVHLAMLSLRATPIDNHLPSPGELLFNRKIRSSLPTKIHNTQPDRDKLSERLVERQSQQKINFDKGTRHLSPMIPGQVVRVKDPTSALWKPATISKQSTEPRSYEILTETGQTLRRNRRHLKETGEKMVPHATGEDLEPQHSQTPHKTNDSNQNTNHNKPYITRSGRIVKPRQILDV